MTAFSTSNIPSSTRVWALIPCAGRGTRSGSDGPKQYQEVAGKPIVLHTLAAFESVPELAGVLVVVSEGDTFFNALKVSCLVASCGGATRAQSVFNGLVELQQRGADASDWVLVHDAARCLITPQLIAGLLDACCSDPVGGLLALKLPDTLKRDVRGRSVETVDRSDKWLAQTPQMFRIGALQAALTLAGDHVTDEASAMEMSGASALLVEGSAQNFKVTYPQDFALAQAILNDRTIAK